MLLRGLVTGKDVKVNLFNDRVALREKVGGGLAAATSIKSHKRSFLIIMYSTPSRASSKSHANIAFPVLYHIDRQLLLNKFCHVTIIAAQNATADRYRRQLHRLHSRPARGRCSR